jgi:hypothetical protein
MRVYFSSGQVGMAQHLAYTFQISSVIQHMRCEAMAQNMRIFILEFRDR